MEMIAPLGNVYQAGTLSGNPVAMIAGFTTLKILNGNPSIYTELEEKTTYLKEGLQQALAASDIPFIINHFGSMISVHFSAHEVTDFVSAASANNEVFKQFFHAMLSRGIYLPPSPFESWFLNNALTTADLDKTITAATESIKEITT
jgi:glutamate-1-semialdehyde 2,1-aminomutase